MSSIPGLKRSQYSSDTFNFVGSTNSFKGEITHESSPSKSVVTKIVDGSVRVTTVADHIRNKAFKHWKNRELAAKLSHVIPAVLVTAAVAATVVGGTFFVIATSEVMLLTACGLVAGAVAAFAFGFFFLGVTAACQRHAKRHKNAWKDPVLQVAKHRQKGGAQGYPYLEKKNNDLRSKCFAPGERTSLALRTCTDYLQRHSSVQHSSNAAKAQFVDEFFSGNPLARDNIRDAFNSIEDLAENLRFASERYQDHEAMYNGVVSEAERTRIGINGDKDHTLDRLCGRRDIMHTRIRNRYNAALRLAGADSRYPNRSCQRNQRNLLAYLNGRYALMQNRIDVEFARARQDVIQRANAQINSVNEWETTRKALYFEPIGQILGSFVHGREVNAGQCRIDSSAEIRAPDDHIRYVFPSFDLNDLSDIDSDNLFGLDRNDDAVH